MAQKGKDRTAFTPSHTGPLILPNLPLFSQLLRHAHRGRLAVRDVHLGIERSYGDLLSDVIHLRACVLKVLTAGTLEELASGQEVFIGVLAAGGYEYAVAMLTVLALGAAAVPMTTALPVDEALYYLRKSYQKVLLTSSAAVGLGTAMVDAMKRAGNTIIQQIEILQSISGPPIPADKILISADQSPNPNAAGVVIFTSGTTGPPKAAVMRRSYTSEDARTIVEHYKLTSEDVMLHVLPVHHATGIGINFFPFLNAGACIEFRSGSFDPAWTWERWRKGGITFFSGVPTIYTRMMRYYEQNLATLPAEERAEYDRAAQLRGALCGTSALPRPLQHFWTRIRGGKILLARYGATEFGAVFKVALDPGDTPDGSVGQKAPGIEVKLSEGEEGEVLVKTPHAFAKYLNDDVATAAAHDAEGFYKTGDIARREGKHYFIVGRASQDIVKSGGYKISALDVEREILSLPYVDEVMVVGVDDVEYGQRVAALVKLREGQHKYCRQKEFDGAGSKHLTIHDLRQDLRGVLAGYKLPTLLRVIDGDIPKSPTGKVQKRVLGPQMFPSPGWQDEQQVDAWTWKESKM